MRWLQGVGWSMRIDPNDSARLHPRKTPGQVGRGTDSERVNPDLAWEGSDLSCVCGLCGRELGWYVCEWVGGVCVNGRGKGACARTDEAES